MKLPEPDTHCFDNDEREDVWSYSRELVQQIVKDEREACEKVCEELQNQYINSHIESAQVWLVAATSDCITAIRARNKS